MCIFAGFRSAKDTACCVFYNLSSKIFQSPELGTKFQREEPLFVEISEFPYNVV